MFWRITDQIKTAMIFALADFVDVHRNAQRLSIIALFQAAKEPLTWQRTTRTREGHGQQNVGGFPGVISST
jgi:hypothetical protein